MIYSWKFSPDRNGGGGGVHCGCRRRKTFFQNTRRGFGLSSGAALDRLVQTLHQGLVVAVGGHVRAYASPDGEAKEVEVSDQVQDLVAHELVGIAEVRVDDLAAVHDDVGIE